MPSLCRYVTSWVDTPEICAPLIDMKRNFRFLLLLLGILSLSAAEPAGFNLTNDARFTASLDRLLRAQPGRAAYPEDECRWLLAVATAADQARRYDLAEAAMTQVTERWPFMPMWATLSCYQGKQGKFTEALQSLEQGKGLPGTDQQQAEGVRAVWLWQVGRRDEATAVINALPEPKAGDPTRAMWLVCRAFFHASCDHDQEATRHAVEKLLALPHVGHWRHFLSRDVAFDALRQEPWFVALIGPTAVGTAPAIPFRAITPPSPLGLLPTLSQHPEEVQARSGLGTAMQKLTAGLWKEAKEHADAALNLAPLPEAMVVKALALAGMDQPIHAMDAIREISHQGISLGNWPIDLYTLLSVSRSTVRRLIASARGPNGSRRAVALALIIHAHFSYAWRDYDDVVKLMDTAETWDDTIAEIANTRALGKMGRDDKKGAEADLRTAIRLNPEFADAHLNLACLRREQCLPAEALALFGEAKRHGATYPGTELQECLFLGAAGHLDHALAIVEAAHRKPHPHRALVGTCWELSSYCWEYRRVVEAEQLTRTVIALQPTWFSAWTKLSGDLARQGKFAEAAECARIHLDGDPDAYDGQLALASWLAHLGNRDEAFIIADRVQPPADTKLKGHYHGVRALYAAAIQDEKMLEGELALVMKAPQHDRQLHWARIDPLFDPYRDKPWFMLLVPPP